jgi:hypothetical protein
MILDNAQISLVFSLTPCWAVDAAGTVEDLLLVPSDEDDDVGVNDNDEHYIGLQLFSNIIEII